jgi:hypothetical protein
VAPLLGAAGGGATGGHEMRLSDGQVERRIDRIPGLEGARLIFRDDGGLVWIGAEQFVTVEPKGTAVVRRPLLLDVGRIERWTPGRFVACEVVSGRSCGRVWLISNDGKRLEPLWMTAPDRFALSPDRRRVVIEAGGTL